MAIEAYIVAFDIQEGSQGQVLKLEKELGAAKETTVGINEAETGGLAKQGVDGVAVAKLVEVLAPSAEAAVEVVRSKYGNNAGGARAVVKPNTNFKIIT